MRQSTYAYLAGLFDGEGHITLTRSKPAAGAMRKHKCIDGTFTYRPAQTNAWQYCLNIGITTTDERLKRWIEERIGGHSYAGKRQQQNWKQAFRWRLTGRKAQERVLLAIIPYLVIKKEQASLALSYIRMNGREDPEARAFFQGLFMKLNRRGESPETNTPATFENVKIESVLTGNSESVVTVM